MPSSEENRLRRSTLQDVASSVGLSVNTVSRALNDRAGVSKATRALIKSEAERLGYVPNANARSLVLGKRKTIAVIVTDLDNPFFADLVSEIEDQAFAKGYTVLLLLSEEDQTRERAVIDAAMHAGVDGIIGVPVQGQSSTWLSITQAGIPLVLLARGIEEAEADYYCNDNEAGGFMTTSTILDRGAKDPLLLEEDLRISTVSHRIAGFRRALEEHGIPFSDNRVVLVPSRRNARGATYWRAEDGYRVVRDLLDTGRRPDAFLVGNDYFALGLYTALAERGISIPHDTQVMGWGDYAFSRFLAPPLSTLRLPSAEVARRATERLFERLEGSTEEIERTLIVPDLALRGSTLPAIS